MDPTEFLILTVPDVESLAELVPAFIELVGAGTISVLDAIAVSRGRDDTVNVQELDAVPGMTSLAERCELIGALLSDRDIDMASAAIAVGSTGLVLVVEHRWAGPLAAAASRVGGRVVTGERIPAARVEAVLADARARRGEADGS
jgi:hypothetical protein